MCDCLSLHGSWASCTYAVRRCTLSLHGNVDKVDQQAFDYSMPLHHPLPVIQMYVQ